MVGPDANDALVAQVENSLRPVSPRVLAHRAEMISRIDERQRLRALTVPVVTSAARQDRLVTTPLIFGQHFELQGPHLLLQARPRAAAEVLSAAEKPTTPASL